MSTNIFIVYFEDLNDIIVNMNENRHPFRARNLESFRDSIDRNAIPPSSPSISSHRFISSLTSHSLEIFYHLIFNNIPLDTRESFLIYLMVQNQLASLFEQF